MSERTVKVALVDDDPAFTDKMREYARRAAEEQLLICKAETFSDGNEFISSYSTRYDMIFLDVEMPQMDGLKTAKAIRDIDQTACLIFVTNVAKYALNGYEVNALDFIVKPVEYFTFYDKFRKALKYQRFRREKYAWLADEDKNVLKVAYSQIYYLEKQRNYIVYHTAQGQFKERGTMAEKEENFLRCGFAKCSSGCIVNLKHVLRIKKNTVWVQEAMLPVSRQYQKSFVNELMRY